MLDGAPRAQKPLTVGEHVQLLLPDSEIGLQMGVAGKRFEVELKRSNLGVHCAQPYDLQGRAFGAPLTPDEAGIHQDSNGRFYCYPAG